MELSIRISGIPLRQATYLDPTGPKILKGRRHHSLRMYSGHRRVKNEAPWASGRYHNMYLKRARKRSKRRKQEFCFNLAILPPFVAYEGSLLRREHFSRKRQTPPRRAGKSGTGTPEGLWNKSWPWSGRGWGRPYWACWLATALSGGPAAF